MYRIKRVFSILLGMGMAINCAAVVLPYQNASLSFEERAEDLVHRLTLEEKVSLMKDQSEPVERLGLKEFGWWNEALHGVARSGKATVFPQAIGMAATFDDEALFRTFTAVSDEARAKSTYSSRVEGNRGKYHNLTFWTPNVNIFRDPRWGRGQETYGEDPYLTSRMGVAVVKGLQGPSDTKYMKTFACAKHFAVHSGPEWNRHSFNAEKINPADLWETYLPAFKALVQEADVRQVMCAYNRFEGAPCCGSDQLLVKILRDDWNYKHIVVSDCGAIDDFYRKGKHETHPDSATASSDAVLAGTDLECGRSYRSLIDGVHRGLISEEQINVSLKRLLKGRFELGDMDPDSLVGWTDIPMSVVNCEKHQALALEMARKSLVLLQNNNRFLPLSKQQRGLIVMGPNANDSVMQWGNYNGTPYKTITMLKGIRDKLGYDVPYINTPYVTFNKDNRPMVDSLLGLLPECEVVLFFSGISPGLEGEEMKVNKPGFRGGDRTTIELPAVQREIIRALKQAGKKIVLVNCSGSAMGLKDEAVLCEGIIQAWYPGEMGGKAVADVLFGDYNPGGRLPVTFYSSDDQLPDYEDYSMKGRTYRFLEEKPLFPFGFGLSYTSFLYGKPVYEKKKNTLSVSVKNTGKMAGDEVVQLYVKRLGSQETAKALRGFKRIFLQAGETQRLTFELDKTSFEFYDKNTDALKTLDEKYKLMIGNSSDEKSLESITLLKSY